MTITYWLISYHCDGGRGRCFGVLRRDGIPNQADIEAWEAEIAKNASLEHVCIASFQQIEAMPDPVSGELAC